MNSTELLQFFSPTTVSAGVVTEGDTVNFEIINNSPFDNEAFERSCHCLGKIKLEPRSITGSLVASKANTFNTVELYKVGDVVCRKFDKVGGGSKYFDINTKKWLGEEIGDAVAISVAEFSQTVTIDLEDGKPFWKVNDDGELTANHEKTKVFITVQFYIVDKKDPS